MLHDLRVTVCVCSEGSVLFHIIHINCLPVHYDCKLRFIFRIVSSTVLRLGRSFSDGIVSEMFAVYFLSLTTLFAFISMAYSRFKGRPKTLPEEFFTFADRICPSRLETRDITLANFQQPLGMSFLTRTTSPTLGETVDRILQHFICD